MKRTFHPSVVRRKRTHGFLVRMRTRGGRAVLRARRAKGRERLSARRRYSPRQRLGTADIASLLSSGRALKRPGFSVLFRANLLGVPRLGLIVPKRIFPRAVDRNRMKRLLRELFRAQQARLGSRDILIRLTVGTVVLAEVERCLVGSS